jgi:hypothetical protein
MGARYDPCVMGNPAEEKAVFEEFLAAAPMFAGAAVGTWSQPKQDPPDIQCDLVDGRSVGLELTTWLDEEQMSAAKRDEGIEISLRQALEPAPANNTEHFFSVWVYAKRRLKSTDAKQFRAQILQVIADLDQKWEAKPGWQSPQGFAWNDFSPFPILTKYLDSLEVHPRMPSVASTMEKGRLGWLTVEPRGGPYSPDEMVDALCDRVQDKIGKYPTKPGRMAEFHPLVHYDKAWEYDSPVIGIDFGYAEAVQAAAARIGTAVGVFDRIFVYVRMTDGKRVFCLFPA